MPEPDPDSYSQAELVRNIGEIKTTLAEMNGRLRSEFVPREVWDQAWSGLGEWKAEVGRDVVNLEAAQSRQEREHHVAHSKIYDHVDAKVKAEREDRIGGQRWAVGLGVTAALGMIGTLLTVANIAAGLGGG